MLLNYREKLAKIPFIKQNVHESIYCIIMASSKINPPVHIKDSETNKSVEYLLNIGSDEPAAWTDVSIEQRYPYQIRKRSITFAQLLYIPAASRNM